MHTFLSRGSGQASARQYVQATSGKGLRPAAQPQRGHEAAVRIDGTRRVLATLRALDCAVGLAERGDARPTYFVRARARQDHGRVDARVVELAADDALEVQVVLLAAIEVEGVEGQRRARRRKSWVNFSSMLDLEPLREVSYR